MSQTKAQLVAGLNLNVSAPASALTVDSTGRVGIGSTAPTNSLEVVGGATSNLFAVKASSGGDCLAVTARAAGNGAIVSTLNSAQTDYEPFELNGEFIYFQTRTGAGTVSERARITSDGKLLVGTSTARSNVYYTTVATTPAVQFETVGSSYSNGLSLINYSSTGYTPVLTLGSSSSATQGTQVALSAGFEMGSINFAGSDGTNFRTGATIVATNDQAASWAVGDCPTRLVFSTTADGASSPTERMRITHNGNVRVGSTTTINNERFLVVADGTFVGATFYQPLTVSYTAVAFNNPNGIVGSITTSGSSTSYATSSDYRLKENIILIPDGITRLQQLKPSRFNFITDPDHTVDGFIAHEVQTVIPEAITGEKDAVDAEGKPVYQGIDQSKLVPLLTAALQEAIAKIETLQGMVAVNNMTIDEQQYQISALAARLSVLETQ